jgi:glycosyltransferase involved in cell wall biosynthesis
MKVLHVPFCYYPDPAGGTEIYVEALARSQRQAGVDAVVAAPGSANQTYSHREQLVYRFQSSSNPSLRQLYGDGDPEAAESFRKVLADVRPGILHMHAFTSGVSVRLVRCARELGIPVVFTYHTPTVTCSRGTLLLWGSSQCDGAMDAHRCASCMLHGKGMPKAASWLLGRFPAEAAKRLGTLGFSGSAFTAFRATELMDLRQRAACELFSSVDTVIAVCDWVQAVLLRNGVDPRKIVVCRQGLGTAAESPKQRLTANVPLRIAFLGRLEAVKGLDVLIDALALAPELAVALDIYAVTQGAAAQALRASLSAKSGHDRRICFHAPLSPQAVVDRLRDYDVLAVPSQWMETGPLVVYEAFAAGTPVIGSDLGGIAELVRHEKNGLLVEHSSPTAWAAALRRLAEDRTLLSKLRLGIGPVRTMQDVAVEMQAVYERILRSGWGEELAPQVTGNATTV